MFGALASPMSSLHSTGISNEKFGPWLRKELGRALKLGSILLVASAFLSAIFAAISPSFADGWTRFNYQLSNVALAQHPVALARTFATRLAENEYGYGPVFSTAPFNITAAKSKLRAQFPEVASVIAGEPQVPRARTLRAANPERYDQRIADFKTRYEKIEARRFAGLYDRDDVFSAPNANMKLSIVATKVFGLLDAGIHTLRSIFAGGLASVAMFITVMSLSGIALWKSRRPARGWLKFVMWPTLASVLVWGAIFLMAVAAAAFGSFTPNTSALALIASLPLLFSIAKLPLHLAESLVLAKKPWDGVDRRAWDGVERRKSRPPEGTPAAPAPNSSNPPPPTSGA